MNIVEEVLRNLFGSNSSHKVKCPRCGEKLVPLPLHDGDTVGGVRRDLDPEFLHFSCWCGYVFSRQRYDELCLRAGLGYNPALNYPRKDFKGAILTKFDYS